MRVASLANGVPPRHAAPRAALAAADALVACDGALAAARALGREPDYVVGDGDSISPADRAALGARFVSVPEQATTDLCTAFRFVISLPRPDNSLSVVLLGATGLREDHALANIFHLVDFTEKVPDTKILTDDGTFTAVRGEQDFPCRPGDAVSVFAPLPGTRVTSSGLAWPLDGVDLSPLWRGTLNRTTSDSFTLRTSHPLLLYRPHQ